MKTMTLLFAFAALFSACTNSSSGNAANEGTALAANTKDPTDQDRNFLLKAASGGMMEVEIGKIAQQKAQNTRVKDFGAMMVRDHSKANNELKTLAASKNIAIPSAMGEHHQSMVEDMKNRTGADFDHAYISMMVNDHEKDISDFRSEAGQGGDGDIRAFASNTLPVLQTHLDSAKEIHKVIKSNIR